MPVTHLYNGLIVGDEFEVQGNAEITGDLAVSGNITGNFIIPDSTIVVVNSSTYNLESGADILHVIYTITDVVTITLPTAQMSSGRILRIKDAGFNTEVNPITVVTEGAEKIDNEDSKIIDINGDALILYTDGNNWFIA